MVIIVRNYIQAEDPCRHKRNELNDSRQSHNISLCSKTLCNQRGALYETRIDLYEFGVRVSFVEDYFFFFLTRFFLPETIFSSNASVGINSFGEQPISKASLFK